MAQRQADKTASPTESESARQQAKRSHQAEAYGLSELLNASLDLSLTH